MDDRTDALCCSNMMENRVSHLERETYLEQLPPLYHDCDLVKVPKHGVIGFRLWSRFGRR